MGSLKQPFKRKVKRRKHGKALVKKEPVLDMQNLTETFLLQWSE
jgi:hypothetical protein